MRPNLFRYATKELSQDALICWLIDWAAQSKGESSEDEELRRCGLRFVSALLNHKRDELVPIELDSEVTTEIHPQERSIDVLARINREHVLLIEDKTDTQDHSNQLSRYYADVVEGRTKFGKMSEDKLRPIYFKTGNQSRGDESRIESIKDPRGSPLGFKVFTRKNFLEILDKYEGHNAILLEFQQYLQSLEDQTSSYMEWTRENKKESWRGWEGFYRRLERELVSSRNFWCWWGYVSNPSGGFLGFSWSPSDTDELYLQIEARLESKMATEATLCFKVSAEGKSSSQKQDLKWNWHKRVMEASGDQAAKPARMRIGETMTVARWQPDWMVFGKNDKLDMPGTIENLKQVETVVRSAMSSS